MSDRDYMGPVMWGFFDEILDMGVDNEKVARFVKSAADDDITKHIKDMKTMATELLPIGTKPGVYKGLALKRLLRNRGFTGKATPERVASFFGVKPEAVELMNHTGAVKNFTFSPEKTRLLHTDAANSAVKSINREGAAGTGILSRAGELGSSLISGITRPIGAAAGGVSRGFSEARAARSAPQADGIRDFMSKNQGLLGVGAGLLGAYLLANKARANQGSPWPSPPPAPPAPRKKEEPRAPEF